MLFQPLETAISIAIITEMISTMKEETMLRF